MPATKITKAQMVSQLTNAGQTALATIINSEGATGDWPSPSPEVDAALLSCRNNGFAGYIRKAFWRTH